MAPSLIVTIGFSLVFVGFVPVQAQVTDYAPFQTPGVIYPGIDVQFVIKAVGEFWSKPRLIEAIDYGCTDILPKISDLLPELETVETACRHVNEAINAQGEFDAVQLCDALFDLVHDAFNLTRSAVGMGQRMRRQTNDDVSHMLTFEFMNKTLLRIVDDLYDIDPFDTTTICPAAEGILVPSLPDHIVNFGTELLAVYMRLGQYYLCDHWDLVVGDLGPEASAFIDEFILIGVNALGFDDLAGFCNEVNTAISEGESEVKSLSYSVIVNALKVFTEASRCSTTSAGVIDVLIRMVPELENVLSDEHVYQYTGYRSIDDICDAMDSSFIDYSAANHVTTVSKAMTVLMTTMIIISAY